MTATKPALSKMRKTQGQGRWLWVVVAPAYEYFHVAASRGAKVLREILGDVYKGILCSDMYSAYTAFHHGVRQFCRSRIIRTIKGIKHACRSPGAVRFSKWTLSETGRMFALWHAFKNGHWDRQTLVRKSAPIRSRMSRCLRMHCANSDLDAAKTAKSLLKHWHGLFTFLEHEGVEPDIDVAKAVRLPNPGKHHAPRLVPALEALRAVITAVLVHDALKIVSRRKPQEFGKDVGSS